MSPTTTTRFRAAAAAIAPAVMLAGAVYHPNVGNPTDHGFTAAIAAAAAADTTRWGLSHLAVGVGSGLLILAFIAIRGRLREAGEQTWSVLALPFVVIGSTLYTLLPAMEFAPLAAAEAGAELAGIQAAQDALLPWFVPILATGAVTFLLGAFGFATAIARSGILSRGLAWLVAGALVVMAVARLVPLGASLPVGAAAGIVALWPVAYLLWKRPQAQLASRP